MGVWGLRLVRFEGLGLRLFRFEGLGLRLFRVQGSGFRDLGVYGLGPVELQGQVVFRLQGLQRVGV